MSIPRVDSLSPLAADVVLLLLAPGDEVVLGFDVLDVLALVADTGVDVDVAVKFRGAMIYNRQSAIIPIRVLSSPI